MPKASISRCAGDDFNVTFYNVPGKEKFVKEICEHVDDPRKGKEVLKKTIQVNHPLHYQGLAFYQSSYGALPPIFRCWNCWKESEGQDPGEGPRGRKLSHPGERVSGAVLNYSPKSTRSEKGSGLAGIRTQSTSRSYWLLRTGSFPP